MSGYTTYDASTGLSKPIPLDQLSFDSSGALLGTKAPETATEPAVLSSAAGKQNFASDVQPLVDKANQIVKTAVQLKSERDAAATAAAAAKNPADQLPTDVVDEMSASKTAEQKAYEDRIANYDQQEQSAKDTYQNLTLASTTAAQAQIAQLTANWQERRTLLDSSNRGNIATWTTQLMRSGQAEYSPGMTSDLLTQKETEGMQKVKALDNEYMGSVNALNAALAANDYKAAAELTTRLQGIEQNALTLMQANAKEANTVNQKLRDNQIQASRDTAIAGIASQGITDPTKILDLLNNDNSGVMHGDFTADEISKTLKNLSLDGTAQGVTTDFKTFQYIRDHIGLHDSIASLPPQEQYLAYMHSLKVANTSPKTPSSNSNNTPAPTWEEYKVGAAKAAGTSYLMAADEDLLRQQYEQDYPGQKAPQKFTSAELKKLEQAGLGGATRQQQLDYLYGKKKKTSGGSDPLSPPDILTGGK